MILDSCAPVPWLLRHRAWYVDLTKSKLDRYVVGSFTRLSNAAVVDDANIKGAVLYFTVVLWGCQEHHGLGSKRQGSHVKHRLRLG